MNKFRNITLAAILAFTVAFGAVFALGSVRPDNKVAAYRSADVEVNLRADTAVPNQVTIPVGQTVQFNTKDGLQHEMGLGEGDGDGHHHEHNGSYSSGEFGEGQAWRVTFKQAGTFTFHDHNHPGINVLVVAYQPKK